MLTPFLKLSRSEKPVCPVRLWRQCFLIGSQAILLFFPFISETPYGWSGGQLTPQQYTHLSNISTRPTYYYPTYTYTAHISLLPHIYLHTHISLIPHIYLHSPHLIITPHISTQPTSHYYPTYTYTPTSHYYPTYTYTAHTSLLPHIYLHSLHLIQTMKPSDWVKKYCTRMMMDNKGE